MNLLYKKLKAKKFSPKNICEIGVGPPENSNIYPFILDGNQSTLIEANPKFGEEIKNHFKAFSNIDLHEVAICDFNGEIELYEKGDSSFISAIEVSPAIANHYFDEKFTHKVKVKARVFHEIDKGDFDLVSIDTEGSEWFAIKNMQSRPKIISIETHGWRYINPYLSEIKNWMKENDYSLWYKSESDSVYFLNHSISITFFEKIALFYQTVKLNLIYKRKRMNDLIYQKLKIKQFSQPK